MPTEEQIHKIATREAQNVSDNGSPGALAHNIKTIAHAIREALEIVKVDDLDRAREVDTHT